MSITARLFRGVVNAIFDATSGHQLLENKYREFKINLLNSLSPESLFVNRIDNLDLIDMLQFDKFNKDCLNAMCENYDKTKHYVAYGNILCLDLMMSTSKIEPYKKFFDDFRKVLLNKIDSDPFSVITAQLISSQANFETKTDILYNYFISLSIALQDLTNHYSKYNRFYDYPTFFESIANFKFVGVKIEDFLLSFFKVYSFITIYPYNLINNSALFTQYFSYSFEKYDIYLDLNWFYDSKKFQNSVSLAIQNNKEHAQIIESWYKYRSLINNPFDEKDFDLLLESYFKVTLLSNFVLSHAQINEVYEDLLNKLSINKLKYTLFLFYSLENFENIEELAYINNVIKLSNIIDLLHPELKVVFSN